jgi:hypothetical protein
MSWSAGHHVPYSPFEHDRTGKTPLTVDLMKPRRPFFGSIPNVSSLLLRIGHRHACRAEELV